MIKYILVLFLALSSTSCFSQRNNDIVYPVAFYNVENLFDTDRDPNILDEDFTPQGKYEWTEDKYRKKLDNLAFVIAKLGREKNEKGIAILGVAEVENRKVMEDLIGTGELADRNYHIVHQDSPDPRGIDVGLIYNPEMFTVRSYTTYPFDMPGNSQVRTRDILLVSGLLDGEPLHVLVNHWPSRRGEDSEPLRERAGSICKHISDSLYRSDPQAGIVIMGDMNDDPKDKSASVALGAKRDMDSVKPGGLYNTMWNIHDSGIGTLRYRGQWNLFDQIIVSQNLLAEGKSRVTFVGAEVFNRDFLFQQSGNYKGYPLRTFSGNVFLNGYSDHFPTLIYLTNNNL